VQSDGELPADSTGELSIDPRLGVIESPTRSSGKALRKAANRCLVRKPYRTAAQAISIIDPHLIWCRDQHISDAFGAQQRFENASTGQFRLQQAQAVQHVGIAEHPPGLGANRRRDNRRSKWCRLGGQSFANPIDH
jgi:hypothetical protein